MTDCLESSEKLLVSTRDYRPEIDGLRAVAVIPVLVFHLSPKSLPGGYLGVDVFFVISGYLITAILLRQLECEGFRFKDFWLRRIKRLFPAVAAVLSLTLFAGYFTLFADEWQSLSRQTISVLTGCANLYMWKHANNYWGESAESMPLLHTWSLSVEEQFYLIFPLILCALFRICRGTPVRAMLAITIVSAIAAGAGMSRYPAASFYLLPTRIWELMTGCTLAALFPLRGSSCSLRNQVVSSLAFAAIIVAYTIDSRYSPLYSGVACLAAAIWLCTASATDQVTGNWLSSPPFVLIGKISFSLYLWHWPVFVIGRKIGEFGPLSLFSVSVTLAFLTYYCVERPTRYMANRIFGKTMVGLLVMLGVAVAMPFSVKRPGIEYTIPEYWSNINLEPGNHVGKIDGYEGDFRTGLILGDRSSLGRLDILVIGDSHSIMFFPAVKKAADSNRLSLAFYGADGGTCPFFVSDTDTSLSGKGWNPEQRVEFDDCRRRFLARYEPSTILVCGRWEYYLQLFGEQKFGSKLEELVRAAPASRFIFVGQPPVLPFGSEGFTAGRLDYPLLRGFKEDAEISTSRTRAHSLLNSFCNEYPTCEFVSTEEIFEGTLGIRFRDGVELYYKDDDHLSVSGALQCVGVFDKCFNKPD